jgi:hypothetical protein
MKRKPKTFKKLMIAPIGKSGFTDVSINHDRYLAEFTYERKVLCATAPAPSPQSDTSKK